MSNLAPTTTAEPCAAEPGRPTLQALPGRRFGEVRAYRGPRIPAPAFLARPVPRA